MTATRLACPHCRTPLRVRDPAALPGPVDCPDCGTSLAYDAAKSNFRPADEVADDPGTEPNPEVDVDGILDAAPAATAPETAPAAREERRRRAIAELDATPRAEGSPLLERPLEEWGERLRSPQGIAWIVAGVCGLGLLVTLFNRSPDDDEPGDTPPPATTDSTPDDPAPVPVDDPHRHLRERLAGLGERLDRYRIREGGFPTGSTADRLGVDERLSWMARLEAAEGLEGTRAPDWRRAYHDPANAEFVQRSRSGFLNPAIEAKTARDGRPATHFVGIAGVGVDGPELPVTHSRAGVFGHGRAATPEEITDGLSSTMLVAGVRTNLGSWAAAGSATVRPLTAEPYVNGPDGFGTGEPNGMSVLMADGSVRTIAANTDPRVVRRMAAIADGLDLALERPGEPGDRKSVEPEPPVVVDADGHPADLPEPDPPAVAVVEPPPEVTIPELPKWTEELVAAKLAQPVKGLRTRKPIAAGQLLEDVADMVGVPIHLKEEDEIDQSFLDDPITLVVGPGTVGDVLDALLEKIELQYVVEGDGLRLKPRD